MRETQDSISSWAEQTFGPAPSFARILSRALEEFAEFTRALTADRTDALGEELADTLIVLCRAGRMKGWDLLEDVRRRAFSGDRPPLEITAAIGMRLFWALDYQPDRKEGPHPLLVAVDYMGTLAAALSIDLLAEVDRKMAVNRGRDWRVDGTGHGYHVRFRPTHRFVEGGEYQLVERGAIKHPDSGEWLPDAAFYRGQGGLLRATTAERWAARFVAIDQTAGGAG